MHIVPFINPAKILLPSEFILLFETDGNWIAHLSQSFTTSSSKYGKIMKDLSTYQDVKRDFLLAWFAKPHDNVVENLSSKDHLTYHKAKKRILNLISNYRSPSGDSSKNSNPQQVANAISSSNRKKGEQIKKGSSSSYNQFVRSVTDITSPYQVLCLVTFGYRIKSLKLAVIEMVPKQ
jgi:hypothetical protein